MTRALVLALALVGGCAPAVRARGACPCVEAQAIDFVVVAALLATSAHAFSLHAYEISGAAAIGGMSIALASNVSECRR